MSSKDRENEGDTTTTEMGETTCTDDDTVTEQETTTMGEGNLQNKRGIQFV